MFAFYSFFPDLFYYSVVWALVCPQISFQKKRRKGLLNGWDGRTSLATPRIKRDYGYLLQNIIFSQIITSHKIIHRIILFGRVPSARFRSNLDKTSSCGSRPSIKKDPFGPFNILGWKDSNLRMPGPKPGALPLGDIPLQFLFYIINLNCQYLKGLCSFEYIILLPTRVPNTFNTKISLSKCPISITVIGLSTAV